MDVSAFYKLINSVIILSIITEGLCSVHLGYSSRKCPSLQIRKAKVRLRSRGRLARVTCIPGYQLLGDKIVYCELGKWMDPLPICIRNGCPSMKSLVPNAQIIESFRGAMVEVLCNDGFTLSGASTLVCNGVSWNDTTPSCYVSKETMQKSCDFESTDFCGWTNVGRNNFNWQRNSMATPSGHTGTGPEFDHTLGAGSNGHYLYIEASNHYNGDVARLVSPLYPPVSDNTSSCFIFWYHMYGGHIGALNVFLSFTSSGQVLSFTQTGNHGNQWIKGVIPINSTKSPFRVIIDGVRGNGYAGDIAIDDLKISEGQECIQEIATTTVTLPGSCLGRCYNNSYQDVDSCYCHEDCHVNNTCCVDYIHFCGAGNQASYYRENKKIITPSTMIGFVLAVLTLGVIITTAVFIIKKRNMNHSNNNVSDDSDVQFLTADDIINFNMARPSPERQEPSQSQKIKKPKKSTVPQDCIRLVEK